MTQRRKERLAFRSYLVTPNGFLPLNPEFLIRLRRRASRSTCRRDASLSFAAFAILAVLPPNDAAAEMPIPRDERWTAPRPRARGAFKRARGTRGTGGGGCSKMHMSSERPSPILPPSPPPLVARLRAAAASLIDGFKCLEMSQSIFAVDTLTPGVQT